MQTMRFALFFLAAASALPQSASSDQRTLWFREAKFGLFIHWGPYSVLGRHEWARHQFQIPQEQYDQYARAFNPVNFDAGAWASLAREAGMKYVVITSKHHDGFSIYRSRVSNYDMEITPYPGDPLKQLSEACQRQGLRLGFYHSIMDWHHPDYRPRRAWEFPNNYKEGGNNRRYVEYMREQLRELLTGYGPVAMIWFDGEWEHTLEETGTADEIFNYIRSIQPAALINDRIYERKPGNKADFGTPEQFVPATGMTDPSGKPILWESCVTINQDSWGYNKYETEFKTTRDLIRMLIEVVSKGGNLLLNVGPTPDGRIQDEFVTRLKAMGQWLNVNGDAIYATTASPFTRLPFFGRATVKGNRLFLHVFEWPSGGTLRVPGLKNLVSGATLVADRSKKLSVSREGDDVIVALPATPPDEVAAVVELLLDGPPVTVPYFERAGSGGRLSLEAASAEIATRFEQRAKKENFLGHVFVTRWTRSDDVPTWQVEVPKAGRYRVEIAYGAARGSAGTEFTVEAGPAKASAKVESTGNALVFRTFAVGDVDLPAGRHAIQVRASVQGGTPAMNLERVVLTPIN
ncbi:MAG TPA: alpha-L-fucosidase [Solibacterales bacterium]|nr:alpha-L-fucosidase [Bryobacterales bacterium]